MKYLYTLLIISLFSSCAIRIGDNYYRDLSDERKAVLQPFNATTDSLAYMEITGADIKAEMPKHTYTWVHLWKAYCGGPHCYPLFYYDRIAQQHKDLRFLLVSHNYDLKTISAQVERAAYRHPVYIIKSDAYGYKAIKNREAVAKELTGRNIKGSDAMHLIFKGDKLIYNGYDISQQIMDSVLKAN